MGTIATVLAEVLDFYWNDAPEKGSKCACGDVHANVDESVVMYCKSIRHEKLFLVKFWGDKARHAVQFAKKGGGVIVSFNGVSRNQQDYIFPHVKPMFHGYECRLANIRPAH